jgi:hypothetical protein
MRITNVLVTIVVRGSKCNELIDCDLLGIAPR